MYSMFELTIVPSLATTTAKSTIRIFYAPSSVLFSLNRQASTLITTIASMMSKESASTSETISNNTAITLASLKDPNKLKYAE